MTETLQELYDKHKIKLQNLKDNRYLEIDTMSDLEQKMYDSQISLLADVLSDIHKILNPF